MKVEYARVERKTKCHTPGQVKYMIQQGWKVEKMDGIRPIAICEVCGLPILDENDYIRDVEGVYWHKHCDAENGG